MHRWDRFKLLCRLLAPGGPKAPLLEDVEQRTWRQLLRVASDHLVTPALYRLTLDPESALHVPSAVRDYLAAVHGLNDERNRAALQVLNDVLGTLAEFGSNPVLLKGAASLTESLYERPGDRILTDLDLLVEPERLPDVIAALQRQGWYSIHQLMPGHHHYPRLLHDSAIFGVELHTEVMRPPYQLLIPGAKMRAAAVPIQWGDRVALVPSPSHRLLHHLGHTELLDGHHALGTVDLRQLLEFVHLQRQFVARNGSDQQALWEAVLVPFRAAGQEAIANGYCGLARALMDDGLVEADPLASERRLRALRRNVSWPVWRRTRQFGLVVRQQASSLWREPRKVAKFGQGDWWAATLGKYRRKMGREW